MSDGSQGPGWWLASDGKWYPPESARAAPPPVPQVPQAWPQMPPQPAPRTGSALGRIGRGCLMAVGGAVVAVAILVVVVVGFAGNSAKHVKLGAEVGLPAQVHHVGETATTSGLAVTVYGFADPQPPPDQLFVPQAGSRWVSVDVQVANPTNATQSFSSLFGLHLLDPLNRVYDEELTPITPKAPDGNVPPGGALRGTVVFLVPNSVAGPFRLRVEGSLTAAGAVFGP